MSGPTPRFDPRELEGADRAFDDDVAGLTAMARELEAVGGTSETPIAAGFEDRVMAALADEPPPRPVARGWSVVALLAMTRDAWRLATTGPRPLAVRVQALALVLLVAIAGLSVGSVAVVGAARWLGSDDAVSPPATPIPSAVPAIPSPSAIPSVSVPPSPSASPSPTPSPSPTASSSPDPTGTAESTDTAEPTETAEPTKTPKPTDTPRPTETLDPDDTPEPTGTDDDSGPGGGGSDDGSGNSGPGGGG
jgi:hypothetical protein